MKPRVRIILLALALAGCGGDEHGDLKEELHQLTKDLRGRVDPLPQVKPYEPVPYTAEGQVDPFRPEPAERLLPARPSHGGQRRPDVVLLRLLAQPGGHHPRDGEAVRGAGARK